MVDKIKKILDDIFAASTGYDEIDRGALEQSPSYGDVYDFVKTLANNPKEEDLQKFISSHPRFLTALEGFGDDEVLAVISKPPIGNNFIADYAVLVSGQGGCCVNLIELEPADHSLFTKKLGPALRYQGAITQIQDWSQWIKSNMGTFIRDTVDRAKKLPISSKKTGNSGFRTRESQFIESVWNEFGGFTEPTVNYTIIIGRWSNLKSEEKKRLISLNKNNSYTTYTYEQMIRRGLERPFGRW